MSKKFLWLRRAGIAEGTSFLVLIGIAMPLKYIFHQPMAVKIFGWAHGILFVGFLSLAWEVRTERNKQIIEMVCHCFSCSHHSNRNFFL